MVNRDLEAPILGVMDAVTIPLRGRASARNYRIGGTCKGASYFFVPAAAALSTPVSAFSTSA